MSTQTYRRLQGTIVAIGILGVLVQMAVQSDGPVIRVENAWARETEVRSEPDPHELARHVAVQWKLPVDLWMSVIQCESNFRHEVYGDNGLAYGIVQFHEATFNWFVKLSHLPDLMYRDMESQLTLMAWAWKAGYADHWTCWKRLSTVD